MGRLCDARRQICIEIACDIAKNNRAEIDEYLDGNPLKPVEQQGDFLHGFCFGAQVALYKILSGEISITEIIQETENG